MALCSVRLGIRARHAPATSVHACTALIDASATALPSYCLPARRHAATASTCAMYGGDGTQRTEDTYDDAIRIE